MEDGGSKLTLLDIDGTLFNTASYREKLLENALMLTKNSHPEFVKEIKDFYVRVFSEKRFFDPELFIKRLREKFIDLTETELRQAVLMEEALDGFLFEDVNNFLKKLKQLSKVGILSKGDNVFQRRKIKSIKTLLDEASIYIGIDKVDLLENAIAQNFGYKIFILDNKQSVLTDLKKLDADIYTIWINRNSEGDLDNTLSLNYNYTPDFKIKSLDEAMEIIKND